MTFANILEINNVSKSYHNNPVLKNINFQVKGGRIFCILGPNGAGKSTLFRCILNLEKQDQGNIRLLDLENYNYQVFYKVGFLPEKIPLISDMKVGEFLILMGSVGRNFDINQKIQILENAHNWLKKMELSNCWKRPLGELSKGMLQKVGLSSCLLCNPEVLFLDEPMSGLDPIFRIEIKEILSELCKEGKTIIINTHELMEIEHLAHEFIIINKGELVANEEMESLNNKGMSLSDFFYETIKGKTRHA